MHLAVFYETVRLWPGLPKNARYAIQDDVLPAIPEQGLPEVRVEKGSYVLWSDRLIMRDKTVSSPAHYVGLRRTLCVLIRYGVQMQTFSIPQDTSPPMAS